MACNLTPGPAPIWRGVTWRVVLVLLEVRVNRPQKTKETEVWLCFVGFYVSFDPQSKTMNKSSLENFRERGWLADDVFEKLVAIENRTVFSVFTELRTLLYVGVLLLSTGVGILVYNNIGDIGHYISLAALLVGWFACLFYVKKHHLPYSNQRVQAPNPYVDYVLLLGALLFLSALGYLQFLFGIFNNYLGLISLLSAIVFFALAYRFDHLGVLSMAITAFAGFLGITITPMHWYDINFFEQMALQWVGVYFGIGLFFSALLLNRFSIKKHFSKTYLNFAIFIGFVGATSLIFENEWKLLATAQVVTAVALGWFSIKQKTAMYMIYAFVFGFIAFSYLVISMIDFEPTLILLYIFFSCISFIAFILFIRKKFSQDA